MRRPLIIQSPKAFPPIQSQMTLTFPSTTLSTTVHEKSECEPVTQTEEILLENEEGAINLPFEMQPRLRTFSRALSVSHYMRSRPITPSIRSKSKFGRTSTSPSKFSVSSIKSRNCPVKTAWTLVHQSEGKNETHVAIQVMPVIGLQKSLSRKASSIETPQRNLSPVKKLKRTTNEAVKMQAAAHSRLCNFLQRKRQIEDKYAKLISDLEIEQAVELNLRIEKVNTENMEKVKSVINDIKNEYYLTKNLLEQQRIVEESELLKEYEESIVDSVY